MSDAVSGKTESHNFAHAEKLASLPPHLKAWDIAPGGCWIAHKRQPNGYAVNTSWGGRQGKKGSVYKLIWEYLYGPVPEGLELDHLCNNGHGGCCNPFHLKAVTHRENMLREGSRSLTKELAEATHCKHGHEFTPENTIYPNRNAKGKVREHWRACKTCRYAHVKKWRAENRERALELQRRYEQSPKGRAARAAKLERYRQAKRTGTDG